jgi:hypothetical protein
VFAQVWDEHDYEKFLKESDARTDKYMELLEKHGDSDEAEQTIAKEMGWLREDQGQGEREEEWMPVEEMNRICEEAANTPPPEPEPHREGIDWIRTKDGDLRHPLQHRCFESAVKFRKLAGKLGLQGSDSACEGVTAARVREHHGCRGRCGRGPSALRFGCGNSIRVHQGPSVVAPPLPCPRYAVKK